LGRFGIVKVWCLCGCFLVGSVMAARVEDHLGISHRQSMKRMR
jgi:hypothetical protein